MTKPYKNQRYQECPKAKSLVARALQNMLELILQCTNPAEMGCRSQRKCVQSAGQEIYPPEVKDFVYITDNAYTKDDILNMEAVDVSGVFF